MLSRQVIYAFKLTDRFTSTARAVARRTESIRKSFRLLGVTAKVAGRGVAGAFRSMAAGAGTLMTTLGPLLAAFTGIAAVVKFFSIGTGFEDAMADLSAITGATGEDLAFLREESMRLGKASKVSGAEVAEAFKLVASAKSELLKDPTALSKVTEQVILLKNATGVDLASAATFATESMNMFGVAADQANRFVNVMAAGAQIGASELWESGEAMRKAGVSAKQAGLTFEETTALIQGLAKGGQKASVAGTGLQAVLLSLETKAAKRFRPSVVGVMQALQNLKDANLTAAQSLQMFGRLGYKSFGTIVDQLDTIKEFNRQLQGTKVANEQAATRLGTLSAKVRGLGVTIANALIRVFDRLAPQFEGIIVDMEKFFDSITKEDIIAFADGLLNVVKMLREVGGAAVEVARVLGPVFKFTGQTISFLSGGLAGKLAEQRQAQAGGSTKSRTDVNVNLKAPAGVVENTKVVTSGKASGLNLGVNMAEAL